jgi:hypothetical protein
VLINKGPWILTTKAEHTPHTRLSLRCWRTEVHKAYAGYYISKEVKDFSKEAFANKYRFDDGIIIIAPKRYSTENIIVNFVEDKKAITHKSLENISTKMKENKIFDGVIVSNAPLSSSAEKVGMTLTIS